MKKKPINNTRRKSAISARRREDNIDFSDIPATNAKDWRGAARGRFYRPVKQQLTVRIDADVLAWLKQQGKGYQSRLNGILRSAMMENSFTKR